MKDRSDVADSLKNDFKAELKRYSDKPDFCSFVRKVEDGLIEAICSSPSIKDAYVQFTRDLSLLFTLKFSNGSFSYLEICYAVIGDKPCYDCVYMKADSKGNRLNNTERYAKLEYKDRIFDFVKDALS